VPSAGIDPGILFFDKCETETRQAVYVLRNTVKRSINGKAIRFKYSDCVLTDLFNQLEV